MQETTASSSNSTAHIIDLKRLLKEKALSLPSYIDVNGSPPPGVKGKLRPNPYIAHTDERLFVVDRNNLKRGGYGSDKAASNTTNTTTSDSKNSTIITIKDALALTAVPEEARPRKLKLIAAVMLILLYTDSSSSSSGSEVPSDLSVDAFLWKLLGGRNSSQPCSNKSSNNNNNNNSNNSNNSNSSNNDDDLHFLDRLNELPRNVYLIPKFKIIAIKPFIIIILKERLASQGLDQDAITSIGKFVDLITLFVQKIKQSSINQLKEDNSNIKAEKDRDIIKIKSSNINVNNTSTNNNNNNNNEIENGESVKEKVKNKIWPFSSEILDCGMSSTSQTLLLSLAGDSSMMMRMNIGKSNGNSMNTLVDRDGDRRRKQLLDLMKRPTSPSPANVGINRPQSATAATTANTNRAAQFNRNTTSCNFFRHETVPIEGAHSATIRGGNVDGSTSPGKIEGVDLADFDYVTMNRGVTEYWNTGRISPSKQNVAPTFPHSKVKSNVPLSMYKDMSRERPKSSNRTSVGEQQHADLLASTRLPSLTKVFENDLARLANVAKSSSNESVQLVYAGGLIDDPAGISTRAQSLSIADETNDDARINSNVLPAVPDFIKSLEIRIYDPQTSLKDTVKVVEYYEYFHQYMAHLLKSCGAVADNTFQSRSSDFADSPKFWSDFIKHTLVVEYVTRKPHQPKQLRVRISREGFRRLVEACAKHSGDAEAFTLNPAPEIINEPIYSDLLSASTGGRDESGTGQSRFQAALKQKVVAAAASNLHSTSTPNLAVNSKLATRPSTAGNSRATTKRLNYLRKGEDVGGEELTDAQIEQVAVYLHSCCRIESSNDITLLELEAAFRRCRFAAISKLQDEYCRGLMEKLSHLLSKTKLTIEGWFNFSDIKGAGLAKASKGKSGDGKVTHLELIDSLSRLCNQLDLPAWSKDDVLKLLRYMDPSGDSDVILLEAELAFRNFHAPPEYLDTLKAATPLVGLLEAHMQRKRIRVVDLFRQIDTDNSNHISIVELKHALRKLFGRKDKLNVVDVKCTGPKKEKGAIHSALNKDKDKVNEKENDHLKQSLEQKGAVVRLNENMKGHLNLRHLDANVDAVQATVTEVEVEDACEKNVPAEIVYDVVQAATNVNNELTTEQIGQLVEYFKSCCRYDSTKEITLLEMEAAFRRHRYAKVSKEQEIYCRGLMERLGQLLAASRLTVEAWFRFSDTRGAGLKKHTSGGVGDSKITHLELIDSIFKLCNQLDIPAWSKDDILKLLRYMDPSGDSDVSSLEVEWAFKRYFMKPESIQILESAGPIVARLENFMKRKRIRVVDLFRRIDSDNSNKISIIELQQALNNLFGSYVGAVNASESVVGDGKVTHLELIDSLSRLCNQLDLPAWSKDDVLKLLRYMDPSGDSDVTLLEAELAFRNFHAPPEYLDTLKAATPLVGLLEAHMQRKRIRVVDLFRQIDTDNSNYISIGELEKALLKMFDGADIDGNGDFNSNDILTSQQIAKVAFYIKSCCRYDESTKEVTLLELEAAFRRYRFVKVSRDQEIYCRDLMNKLENLLTASKMTVMDWFKMSDVKGAGLKKNSGVHTALEKDREKQMDQKEEKEVEKEVQKQKGVIVQAIQVDKATFQAPANTEITTVERKEDKDDSESAEIRQREARKAKEEVDYKRKADADAEIFRRKTEFDAHNKKLMEEAEKELIKQAAEIEAKNKSNTELKVMNDRLAAMEEQIRIRKAEKEAEIKRKQYEIEAANKAEKRRKEAVDAAAEANGRSKMQEDEIIHEVLVEDDEHNNDFHNAPIKTTTAVTATVANITPSSISDSNYENDFEEAIEYINHPTNASFGDKGVVKPRVKDVDASYEEVPDYEEVYDEEANENSNKSNDNRSINFTQKVAPMQHRHGNKSNSHNSKELVEQDEEIEDVVEEEEAGPPPLKSKLKQAKTLAVSGINEYLFETAKVDNYGYEDDAFDEDDSITEERLKAILHK